MEEERAELGDGRVPEGALQARPVLDGASCTCGARSIERVVPGGRPRDPKGKMIRSTPGMLTVRFGSFADDARAAITTSPDYFVRWYTLKSIGLGLAVGVIGFLLGRATTKR